ncbi:hypothetical protein SB18R_03140 [Pseudomonas oryzihabitans]|nr:hypothetical protein SB9_12375 [Pseudomonas psychrotolerans]KTT78243.1 hypothetical protein SB18R_03140 [Pseudomonas psychrotolerans]
MSRASPDESPMPNDPRWVRWVIVLSVWLGRIFLLVLLAAFFLAGMFSLWTLAALLFAFAAFCLMLLGIIAVAGSWRRSRL